MPKKVVVGWDARQTPSEFAESIMDAGGLSSGTIIANLRMPAREIPQIIMA